MVSSAPPRRTWGVKRDVTGEPRDDIGRWTAIGQVNYLNEELRHMGAPPLHDLLERYHWYNGHAGLSPRGGKRLRFTRRPWWNLFRPSPKDPMAHKYVMGSDPEIEHVVRRLSETSRRVLKRLAYGDIPTSWARDNAYLDHLKKWSQGSKLVSGDGLPYRVFHGTDAAFSRFDPLLRGEHTGAQDARLAFFFTGSPEDAGFFAFLGKMGKAADHRRERVPNVMPVHIRLKNPIVVVDPDRRLDMNLSERVLDYARGHGYDGMVMYSQELPSSVSVQRVATVEDTYARDTPVYKSKGLLPRTDDMVVAAFSPFDIKSATGNSGTFDNSDDMSKSSLFLLANAGTPLLKARDSGKPTHNKIRYHHPNYPNVVREGLVLSEGKDGYTVMHLPSGHEECIRREHVVSGKKRMAKSVGGALSPLGQNQSKGKGGDSGWNPLVVKNPYRVGHGVTYQRPDMSEPATGRIDAMGKHGAIVSRGNGARHIVRWEDVHGRIQAGILPEQKQETAAALKQLGIPMDPLEELLPGDRKPKADQGLLGQLQALSGVGAPIDAKRAAQADGDTVRRLIGHLTESRTLR